MQQSLSRCRSVIMRDNSDLRERLHEPTVTPSCECDYVIDAYNSGGENPVLGYVSSALPHCPIDYGSSWRTLERSRELLRLTCIQSYLGWLYCK